MSNYARTARASAGAMLLVEKRTLTLLRREARTALGDLSLTIGGATTRNVQPGARVFVLSAISASTKDLADRVSRTTRDARSEARSTALERTRRELLDLGVDGGQLRRSDGAEDAALGDIAGSSFAAAWGASMMREVLGWADDPTRTPQLKAANDALEYRLARIAATEVAAAYNDEHGEAARRLAAIPAYRGHLFRRWDAMLDRRLCKICRAMDGQVVPVDGMFTARREPGLVHPMCRCIEVVIGDDVPLPSPVDVIRVAVPTKAFAKKAKTYERVGASGYAGEGGGSGGGGSSNDW